IVASAAEQAIAAGNRGDGREHGQHGGERATQPGGGGRAHAGAVISARGKCSNASRDNKKKARTSWASPEKWQRLVTGRRAAHCTAARRESIGPVGVFFSVTAVISHFASTTTI